MPHAPTENPVNSHRAPAEAFRQRGRRRAMSVPSIKGTAYNSIHEDLHKMLDDGRVTRDEIEASLTREELESFDSKVLATKWYPVAGYRKLLALVAAKEGKGRIEEYLVERGWRAAEKLREAGIYRQLG